MSRKQEFLVRIACGDDMGYTKVVGNTKPNAYESMGVLKRWGDAVKSRAVTCMSLLPSTLPEQSQAGGTLAIVGRADGSAQLISMATGDQLHALPTPPPCPSSNGASTGGDDDNDVAVVGAYALHGRSSAPSCLLTYTNGMVQLCGDPAGDKDGEKQSVSSWRVAQRVACSVVNPACTRLAIGGNTREPSLWDIGTQQCVVNFKPGKPTRAGLGLLPCTSALSWFSTSGGGGGLLSNGVSGDTAYPHNDDDNGCFVAGTAKHRLLLYDARVGRRPQLEVVWGEHKVTSLAANAQDRTCWAGNGMGSVQQWDMRANKMNRGLRGAEGSVKSITLHPHRPLLLTASLDKSVRVYDTRTRALLGRGYTKQPVHVAVFLPDEVVEVGRGGEGGAGGVGEGETQRGKRVRGDEGGDGEDVGSGDVGGGGATKIKKKKKSGKGDKKSGKGENKTKRSTVA